MVLPVLAPNGAAAPSVVLPVLAPNGGADTCPPLNGGAAPPVALPVLPMLPPRVGTTDGGFSADGARSSADGTCPSKPADPRGAEGTWPGDLMACPPKAGAGQGFPKLEAGCCPLNGGAAVCSVCVNLAKLDGGATLEGKPGACIPPVVLCSPVGIWATGGLGKAC